MPDNSFPEPRSPLTILEDVPESLRRRLKQYSGRLATETVQAMQERLPFFADLEASQRASVQLVVQTAVVNFAEWLHDPGSDLGYTAEAFALVPQELTRHVALRQTVDMVRVTTEFLEELLPMLGRNEEQTKALTVGILRYSRDLAFAAAASYADAAEARGAWDTRMEANIVDAIVRGDAGSGLQSQAAALNWDATAPATVIVGTPRPDRIDLAIGDVHAAGNRHNRATLSDVHGTWLVAIVAGSLSLTDRFLADLLTVFDDGPVVVGPTAASLSGLHRSAAEAIAGMHAVAGWSGAPRPVSARELLPERALLGDENALAALESEVMHPLADAGPALTETLDTYLDSGGAIEACARKLFVHPNTVRYRLKRIADFTGRDPTVPRDAYVLRVATTVGRLQRDLGHFNTTNGSTTGPVGPLGTRWLGPLR
ncbi:PucR family transcriptional regulator [Arthrobacter sp. SLBN-53]|uniref:PucR family transcriptional regulator n=1 Tax=Arthrobacter sp. SLBN-53 TaxID=2768412 RepID=UPI00114D87E8|nr:PucR family transcriptional regulator [Arthrobacter sp. SLBN-53]